MPWPARSIQSSPSIRRAWSPRSGRFPWDRWIREHEPLPHQSAGLQREPGALLQRREQLLRPSHTLLRIVTQRHPEDCSRAPGPGTRQRAGGLRIGRIDQVDHVDGLDERAQVVGHRRLALPALARERGCRTQGLRDGTNGIRIHARTQDRAIDRCGDTSRQGRLPQPHVLHVHQRVAGRKDVRERLAHAPAWEPLDQPDVNQLALAGDRGGQRCGLGEPGAGAGTVHAGDR